MSFSEQTMKIIAIGESSVGKTGIISKYVDDSYNENLFSTLGVDFKRKTETIDGRTINLKIWDTACHEYYRNIQKIYFHNTDGVFLFFDLTNKKTFENLNYWISCIKAECPEDVIVCLVGNKVDLVESIEVKEDEIKNFCQNKGNLKYFAVCASDGKNIKEMFQYIAKKILEIKDKKKEKNICNNKNIILTKTTYKTKIRQRCYR